MATENKTQLIELLFQRATEYGKTSIELAKLKTIDKTSDVVSSFIPYSIAIFLIASFLFFVNLGLAFWLGDILGKVYWGFFIVAVFYGVIGVFVRLFLHKWIKKQISNSFIKKLLN